MADESTFTINIDTEQFTRFNEQFKKYADGLKATNDQWKKISDVIGKLANAMDTLASKSQRASANIRSSQNPLNQHYQVIQRIAQHWGLISGHTGRVVQHLGLISRLAGGTGMVLGPLALIAGVEAKLIQETIKRGTDAAVQRMKAYGMGVSYGGLRAFTGLGPGLLPNPQAALSGLGTARWDMGSAAYRAYGMLYGGAGAQAAIRRPEAEVIPEALGKAVRYLRTLPEGARGPAAEAAGFNAAFGQEQVRAWMQLSESEIKTRTELLQNTGKQNDALKKQLTAYDEMALKIGAAKTSVETTFLQILAPMAKPLGEFAEGLAKFLNFVMPVLTPFVKLFEAVFEILKGFIAALGDLKDKIVQFANWVASLIPHLPGAHPKGPVSPYGPGIPKEKKGTWWGHPTDRFFQPEGVSPTGWPGSGGGPSDTPSLREAWHASAEQIKREGRASTARAKEGNPKEDWWDWMKTWFAAGTSSSKTIAEQAEHRDQQLISLLEKLEKYFDGVGKVVGAVFGGTFGGSGNIFASGGATPAVGGGGGATPGASGGATPAVGGGGRTPGGGGGATPGAGANIPGVASKGKLVQHQKEAYDEFKRLGYSDTAARAAVANLSGESLANPADVHHDPSGRNPNQMAHGIASWDDARSQRIFKQFGKYPQNMSVAEQVRAFDWETKNYYKPTYDLLHSGASAEEMLSSKQGGLIPYFERSGNQAADIQRRTGILHGLRLDGGGGGGGDGGGGGAGESTKGMDPEFLRREKAFREAMAKAGITTKQMEGFRDPAYQASIAARGAGVGAGKSYHEYGLAADVYPVVAGTDIYGKTGSKEARDKYWAQIHQMDAEAQKYGLESGGFWKSRYDPGHFQIGIEGGGSNLARARQEQEARRRGGTGPQAFNAPQTGPAQKMASAGPMDVSNWGISRDTKVTLHNHIESNVNVAMATV